MTFRRYRWRTQFRKLLPVHLAMLIPRGHDCGPDNHEWYVSRQTVSGFYVWECYHCVQKRTTERR